MRKVITPERFEEIKATGQLPSPKGVALAVINLIRREDVTMPEVAKVVQSDPALSGRVLKLANSAHAGMRRPIASISEAVSVLGFPTLRQIALGLSVLSNYRSGQCKNFNYQDFWSGSLATAIATQLLSTNAKTSPEETFICGLLGNIGRLALATLFPEAYSEILEKTANADFATVEKAEYAAFATTQRELTTALLLDWGLPKLFVNAVYFHEVPEEGGFEEGSRDYVLTYALHLATRLARVCLTQAEERRKLLPDLYRMAAKLGIDAEQLASLTDRIVAEWQSWGKILDVPTQALPPFAEIAASLPALPETSGNGNGQGKDAFRILLVDDSPSILQFVSAVLSAAGHIVATAESGKAALESALEFRPQIIITDWVMPEMDGISLCKALRATQAGRRIYLILLTALDDEAHLVEAFEAGVDDYIVKPLNEKVIKARMRAGERVIRLQEEIEREREEIRRYAAELAVTNRRLQEAALTDPLTTLPNRRYGMDRMEQEWAVSLRNKRMLACLMIDIDRFKQINDNHGHDVGDAVLRQSAKILRDSARTQDLVCRLGGEEFLVICPDTSPPAALQCAERIRKTFEAAFFQVENERLRVTVSIGVAGRGKSMTHFDQMFKAADQALYAAKAQGRNRVLFAKQEKAEVFWDSPI
ncbi:MAG: diguanylate cyclase [Sulfuricella sp.]|nr:diguanylate cyclase [Sulfuricella sp.]